MFDVKKMVLGRARKKTIELLTTEGFKLIGGSEEPLPPELAKELVEAVDDKTLEQNMPKEFQLGDGTIIKMLQSLIIWISGHSKEIIDVVKLIMNLISMFGDKNKPKSS